MEFINIVEEKLTILINDYLSEYSIIIFLILGIGLLLVSLFLPQKIRFHKIDLKRILDNNKITMSKKVNYFHNLSSTGIFRLFQLEDDSKKYKEYENLIKKLGGLEGCTPNIIYMFKWLIMFGIQIISIVILFLIGILNPRFNEMNFLFLSIIVSVIGFFAPEFYLKNKIKNRKKEFLSELDTVELFSIIYLSAGYNIYDLLQSLMDVTYYIRPMVSECINEFYINQEKALQNLADKIDTDEYQILMDILKQATRISPVNMVEFISNQMKQLKKFQNLSMEAQNKKRPLKYVFILALPLISVIILWFYPLMVNAMKMINQIGNI